MATPRRTIFILLGSILALVFIAILCIPLFLNADSFRNRIESTLSTSLGRKVTVGQLDLSVWSGGLLAKNATVADDPAFSTQPFLQAALVKIKVELLPLIISRELRITGFAIDTPRITLLRAANGTWNYSTIGSAAHRTPAANKQTADTIPNLTVGHVTVTNGQLTVGIEPVPGAPTLPRRTYSQLELDAKNFSFEKSFPFTLSAHLPADGTVSLTGTAGPVNQRDASLTPFTAHLEMKHLDPLAAGFLDATAGVTGLINVIDVQATWNGQQLHVANLLIDTPKLTLMRTKKSSSAPSPPDSNNMLSTLTADRLQIKNGAITLVTPGQPTPAVYQQLNVEITNFSPTTGSPIKLNAQIPGGGSVTADGNAGPLNQQDAAATPLNLHATLTHIDLASSGIIAPDAGISGLANIDTRAISDGQTLNANANAHVDGLRLAKNGAPSARPVDLDLSVSENMQALTGQIQHSTVTIGRATINIAGTYQTSGPTTALNLQVGTQAAPIDELEAFLPSVGVHLPTGSRLQGGTLTTSLNVTGSSASPVINGPLRLDNTNLAGFDLGSKLSAVTALTGRRTSTGSGTAIRSLSTNIRVANGDVRTDNLALVVPALGTATGAGTVAASGALSYQVILKLTGLLGGGDNASSGGAASVGGIAGQLLGMIPAGGAAGGTAGAIGGIATSALRNGVPVAIGGTTSNPTFTPNLSGVAASSAKGLLNGAQPSNPGRNNPSTDPLTNALGGLLNRHK